MSTTAGQSVFLDGNYLPLAEARISVLDRGFLFGDGVYEVIPVYGGHPFRLAEHLRRLDSSLQQIGIPNPHDTDGWARLIEPLLDGGDQGIYLQVTRGVDSCRDHRIPQPPLAPTCFIMPMALVTPDAAQQQRGIHAITLDDIRWQLCQIKATTLLANVLLKAQASHEQAQEAILVRDGQALEGAASNLFIVSNGLLITPPKSPLLLPGITRDLVLELAFDHRIPFAEAAISVTDLEQAEEIWLTSSNKEVMAVTRLNGRPVANGTPGPVWRQMNDLYRACKVRLRSGEDAR